jgi:hypothetical protein
MAETAEKVTRDLGEKTTSYAKETYGKTQAASAQATKVMEQTYFAASKSAAEFNVHVLDMAQENVEAAFDFAREVARMKSPTEFLTLWPEYLRKQYQTFNEQTSSLASFAHKATTEAAQPLQENVENLVRKASR